MAVTMKVFSNNAEWLMARKNRIGGSEASAIVGMNPYMTNVDLWELKTGKREPVDISNEPYVIYGHRAEECLRELFALDYPRYQLMYVENNMFFNDKYPFAHASLDSWLVDKETGRKGVLEIKTTNILQSIQKEKWNHRIPDNYYIQVLHYLLVTEAEFSVLKAQLKYDYDGDIFLNTKHYMIERSNVEEDIEFLKEAEIKFYQHIKNDIKPNLVLPEI